MDPVASEIQNLYAAVREHELWEERVRTAFDKVRRAVDQATEFFANEERRSAEGKTSLSDEQFKLVGAIIGCVLQACRAFDDRPTSTRSQSAQPDREPSATHQQPA